MLKKKGGIISPSYLGFQISFPSIIKKYMVHKMYVHFYKKKKKDSCTNTIK